MLVAERRLDHTYPHCWRCKNPTLFRATEQWFIELDKQGFRASVLEAIKRDVQWIPPWGEERIYNMVAHRPEWVISRQRVWGVPIVAFYCAGCGTLLLEERIIDHVARIFREGQGADEWYARAARALLPPGTRCAKCGGDRFAKETDILDVWFDSGCSHAAVLETRDRIADAYRRIRNTFRFLLGNLSDFDPARDRQSSARLDEIDRWILDRLGRLIGRVTRAYETYEFHTVFHAVHNFCAVD